MADPAANSAIVNRNAQIEWIDHIVDQKVNTGRVKMDSKIIKAIDNSLSCGAIFYFLVLLFGKKEVIAAHNYTAILRVFGGKDYITNIFDKET